MFQSVVWSDLASSYTVHMYSVHMPVHCTHVWLAFCGRRLGACAVAGPLKYLCFGTCNHYLCIGTVVAP